MKEDKEESVFYREKNETKNLIREIGNFYKIDPETLKSVILILDTTIANFSSAPIGFWCLPAFLSLVLKIKEKLCFRINSIHSYRDAFVKKYYNFYQVVVPENIKKFYLNSRNLILFIGNFILKGLQFKIHFKLVKKLSYNFLRMKKFLESFFSIPKEFRKMLSNFGNFEKKSPVYHFLNEMSLGCTIGSEIWIRLKLHRIRIPWWRFINVRECELEFFEQSFTFQYCSTFNIKNKNKR
mmetsp:Transcript_8011/g.15944  ORF Transcript_8011/g.15944 Transcript_8011/m.15944 type:complete len:239 (+) Transcript_8011:648-1364(+)